MRTSSIRIALTAAGLVVLVFFAARGVAGAPGPSPAVYYNQEDHLNERVIQLIQKSDDYIVFAVYTFTRRDIADALLAAHARGVKVAGVTDGDQYEQTEAQAALIKSLRKAGIDVYTDTSPGLMHMKVLVTEKGYASGSYNWTSRATEENDEVIEIGGDTPVRDELERIVRRLIDMYRV